MNMLSGRNLKSALAVTGICLLWSGHPLSAIILEDFESDTAGQPPANGALTLGADGVVNVVGSDTTPADPFGPGGNQSLYFNQPGTAFSQVIFTGAATGEGLTSGTASLRFYPDAGARAFVRLQDAAGTGDWGPYIQISTVNRLHFYSGTGAVLTDQVWVSDDVNELVINWSGGTYTGELNGVSVTAGAQNVFDFYGSPATISQAVIRVGGAPGDTITYFDDLAVVPEPATTALLLAGAALGLLAFRRRRQAALKKD